MKIYKILWPELILREPLYRVRWKCCGLSSGGKGKYGRIYNLYIKEETVRLHLAIEAIHKVVKLTKLHEMFPRFKILAFVHLTLYFHK